MVKFHTLHTRLDKIEKVLTDLEDYANGNYEVISIFTTNETFGTVAIVFKLIIQDEFNEEEIKRKLGY